MSDSLSENSLSVSSISSPRSHRCLIANDQYFVLETLSKTLSQFFTMHRFRNCSRTQADKKVVVTCVSTYGMWPIPSSKPQAKAVPSVVNKTTAGRPPWPLPTLTSTDRLLWKFSKCDRSVASILDWKVEPVVKVKGNESTSNWGPCKSTVKDLSKFQKSSRAIGTQKRILCTQPTRSRSCDTKISIHLHPLLPHPCTW